MGTENQGMKQLRKLLIDFYVSQYNADAAGKRPNKTEVKDPGSKMRKLAHSLHTAQSGRTTLFYLEDYHRRIRNLVRWAKARNKQEALDDIYRTMIPELVRLDLGFMTKDQVNGIDEGFFDYLRGERGYSICRKPLFMLYPGYKEQIIREQMTEMVPTRPEMEFPEALEMKRHFILHVGPTNSGKTYQALERLKTAKNGIYLGPLRLLALEVYEKMHDMGVPAMMLTGQECIEDDDPRVTAATVEMADLDVFYDIAVIDEAQLMSDPDRGHSWTRAILGLKAKEIHVCLSPAAERVLTGLIDLCHDTYEVNHYERKTKLLFEDQPFNFPEDVQQGDALIVFSKKSVLDVAGRLEESGIECSVIYGSLPPEIRRRQMHLFTSGTTKVVVSTDAIGMGLNLPVRRIIFLQVTKFDGTNQRLLATSEVRQIAGRAGRFGIYDTGYINAEDEDTLSFLQRTYGDDEPEVDTVNIGFPQVLLDINEPMDEILKVWHDQKIEAPFEKENVDEALFLYEKAKAVRSRIVGFDDKHLLYRMISCPIDIKDKTVVNLWLEYCLTYTADKSLRKPRPDRRAKSDLLRWEVYYKELDTYYQMSYRLGKEMDDKWIRKERAETEDKIMRYLMKDKMRYIKRCRYCGRVLPIDYPFNVCERCYESQMGY